MPSTPGLPGGAELPGIPAEVASVIALTPDPVILAEPHALGPGQAGAPAGPPTRAGVLTQLPRCAIAHFACHAYSDPADPSRSTLLLSDYASAPLTVAELAPVQHDQLQLVYLSACRTAFTSAAELLDESIHLASAFSLAGARHVIGTLWEIGGVTAPSIATGFYRQLRTSPASPGTGRAATALHHAVRAARDASPLTPAWWAAHIHIGP